MTGILQAATAVVQNQPTGTPFRDIVEMIAGLVTVAGFVYGALKLGRVLERQDGFELRQTALQNERTAQLNRIESKMDTSAAQTAERLSAWSARAERWDGRHAGAEGRLDGHDEEIKLVRERTHTLTNEIHAEKGYRELLTQRVATIEGERRHQQRRADDRGEA